VQLLLLGTIWQLDAQPAPTNRRLLLLLRLLLLSWRLCFVI
jgi:hypothetical protein